MQGLFSNDLKSNASQKDIKLPSDSSYIFEKLKTLHSQAEMIQKWDLEWFGEWIKSENHEKIQNI